MTGTPKDPTRKCRVRRVRRHRDGTQKVRLVVVHGIGSQKAGATAARWADAIVRFARAAGHRTEVTTADLTGSPAGVTVHLTPPVDKPDAAPPTSEIKIEEAYWADSFAEPSLGRVLRFLLTVAPVLAITQSILIWRSRDQLWPGGWRNGQALGHVTALVGPLALGVLALGIAAPVIAVLLLVLLIASSLPIPAVRRMVGKTLGWLTTSIGDAYLFVADPVNRAAMQGRLAERLAEESDVPPARTVVLAHSQGAALAYRALGDMPLARRPAALVTVGSGVGRLREVGLLQTLPWYLTPLFVAAAASAATALALAPAWWTPGLLLLSAVLTLVAWRTSAWWLDGSDEAQQKWWRRAWWTAEVREKRKVSRKRGLLEPIEKTTWLDIWASFDPVPNGRAAVDRGSRGSYQLARVAGEQSLVRDHVRYDLDWDQTMPLILTRLLAPSEQNHVDYVGVRPPRDDGGPERLERMPLTSRDWWGLACRSVPLLSAGVALFLVDLFGLGQWLRTAPPGFLDSTVDAVFVPLRAVADFLEGVPWPRAPRPQQLLGAAALLALGLAGSILTRRVLTFFQRRETSAWLRAGGFGNDSGDGRWPPRTWKKCFGVVALAAAVVPGLLLWSMWRVHWTPEQTVEAYLTAVAEDDIHGVCEVTAAGVLEGCGTGDQDGLRTCGDAREAVAALAEDAAQVDGRSVTITWNPEMPPTCDNEEHAPLVPTRVDDGEGDGDGQERWKVTAVGPPES